MFLALQMTAMFTLVCFCLGVDGLVKRNSGHYQLEAERGPLGLLPAAVPAPAAPIGVCVCVCMCVQHGSKRLLYNCIR